MRLGRPTGGNRLPHPRGFRGPVAAGGSSARIGTAPAPAPQADAPPAAPAAEPRVLPAALRPPPRQVEDEPDRRAGSRLIAVLGGLIAMLMVGGWIEGLIEGG